MFIRKRTNYVYQKKIRLETSLIKSNDISKWCKYVLTDIGLLLIN